MKLIQTGFIVFLLCFTVSSYADNGLVTKASAYSVAQTMDRFSDILKKKGITLFARINHAQGAKDAGLSLPPLELIIFGKPQLGNPLMNLQPEIGIDLPLKAIAWQDKDGKVWLAYNSPAYMAKRHSISEQHPVIKKMTGALNKFSDYATKAAH